LVRRCNPSRKGRSDWTHGARGFFPWGWRAFDDQDRRVLREVSRSTGDWNCIFIPAGDRDGVLLERTLIHRRGESSGLSGISRDVADVGDPQPNMTGSPCSAYPGPSRHTVATPDLAARAQLSVFQFDQRIRLCSPLAGQYLTRARIELACNRLRQTGDPISVVAQECGYADQRLHAPVP